LFRFPGTMTARIIDGNALAAQNVEVPGGRVDQGRRELTVRTLGRVERPADFLRIIVANNGGTPVRVGDIADVEDGVEEPRSLARLDGTPAVVLEVRKQAGTNTLDVIHGVKNRIAELQKEITAMDAERKTQRARRKERDDLATVALVGYTNAGKSTLMRALTGSDVLVADRLFATLDTTVRALQPESRPRVLVSDTVGFLRQLPHDLVASFRSTLDEALEASLLLYVVDASDPSCQAQLDVTREVLRDIGAAEVPGLLLLNKIDRLDEAARRLLAERFPGAIQLSAKSPADVAALRQRVLDFFEVQMVEADLQIPYASQGRIAEVYETARVLSETFDESGRHLRVRSTPGAIAKLQRAFEA